MHPKSATIGSVSRDKEQLLFPFDREDKSNYSSPPFKVIIAFAVQRRIEYLFLFYHYAIYSSLFMLYCFRYSFSSIHARKNHFWKCESLFFKRYYSSFRRTGKTNGLWPAHPAGRFLKPTKKVPGYSWGCRKFGLARTPPRLPKNVPRFRFRYFWIEQF